VSLNLSVGACAMPVLGDRGQVIAQPRLVLE